MRTPSPPAARPDEPARSNTVRGAVLFADLRGYTTLAERLDPLTVCALLEEFFATAAVPVSRCGGTVCDMAGDTLLAGFGLGDSMASSAQQALEAGKRIVAACARLATRWEEDYGVATGVGVGLHVGDCAHIELGPPPIRRRTLIGDTVNVAARLCQRARAGEVLFSAGVVAPLDPRTLEYAIALPELPLRGRREPVRIYCVPAPERIRVDPAFAVALAGVAH